MKIVLGDEEAQPIRGISFLPLNRGDHLLSTGGKNISNTDCESVGSDHYVPWAKIAIVGGLAFAATVLFTVIPSFSVSRVIPVAAPRFD